MSRSDRGGYARETPADQTSQRVDQASQRDMTVSPPLTAIPYSALPPTVSGQSTT